MNTATRLLLRQLARFLRSRVDTANAAGGEPYRINNHFFPVADQLFAQARIEGESRMLTLRVRGDEAAADLEAKSFFDSPYEKSTTGDGPDRLFIYEALDAQNPPGADDLSRAECQQSAAGAGGFSAFRSNLRPRVSSRAVHNR